MSRQTKVAAVVLAGGRARRMQNQDKGLVSYRGRPLVSYALDALAGLADRVVISANRNLDRYSRFGFEVIADRSPDFDGPLAGILAAMTVVEADVLLVVPCDSPLIKAEHLQRLLALREAVGADAAVAFDGRRLHPVFLALTTGLRENLQNYLDRGGRKVEAWLEPLHTVSADFATTAEIFFNINTLAELDELERSAGKKTL